MGSPQQVIAMPREPSGATEGPAEMDPVLQRRLATRLWRSVSANTKSHECQITREETHPIPVRALVPYQRGS